MLLRILFHHRTGKPAYGLSDKSFFAQSIPKIKQISEQYDNYYGVLIMLTNHTPFSEVDKYGDFEVNIKELVTNDEFRSVYISQLRIKDEQLENVETKTLIKVLEEKICANK